MNWRQFTQRAKAHAALNSNAIAKLERDSIAMIQDFAWRRNGMLKLSFSGGKDSTLMLHIARKSGVSFISMWFADLPFPGTLEIMHANNVKLIHFTNWYIEFIREYGQPPMWSSRPAMDAVIHDEREIDDLFGIKGTLVGMRRDESKKRLYALKQPVIKSNTYSGGWRCAPIAAWREMDVWAYLIKHNIGVHPHYQRMIEINAPLSKLRVDSVASLFCGHLPADDSIQLAKALYPATISSFVADNPMTRHKQ